MGRDGTQGLRLQSLATSRKHGELRFSDNEGWTYVDVGSTGGTTINDVTVTKNVAVSLFNGDRLGFGAAVETSGADGPEYWVVKNVGRERPSPLLPFPGHQDEYARSIIATLSDGLKDVKGTLERRDFDSMWSTAGRVINQLKNASALFKLRTEGTDRVDRITGEKKRRIENGRQDEKRWGKRGRRR